MHSIKKFSFFSVLIFFLCLFAANAWAGPLKRFIVLANDASEVKGHVSSLGGETLYDLSYHNGFVANLPDEAVNRLKDLFGEDIFVEEDFEVTATGKPSWAGGGGGSTTQPPQETPWGVSTVLAPNAWASVSYGTRGAGVLVCVVDTGIQSDHPDLSAGILGENFVGKGPLGRNIDPAKWNDDNGHGTHVAGTVAALDNDIGVVGVAPEASLFATKVLDQNGSGYASAVADGIRSCIANGAHVVNMSLGSSSDSTVIREAVQDASAAGLILVAAAGNDGDPSDPNGNVSYPAKYPEVYAVSAIDSTLNLAWFSSRGPEVDFAAPGADVYSTWLGGSYATKNGTSMASPHVSGVAALLVSSSSLGFVANDLGLTTNEQGAGLINALGTVENQ